MKPTLAVIGGGASGLCAAVCAGRSGAFGEVLLLERGPRVGKKLLATGNGRCNLSNRFFTPANYRSRKGDSPEFIRPAFEAFGLTETLAFFESIGIVPYEEDGGKLYPRSLQAAAVLDALRLEAEAAGVSIRCETEVTGIRPTAEGFLLLSEKGRIKASLVLLAAGGAASPKLGGSDSGVKLLEALGHRVTPLIPSIVQLKTELVTIRALTGIKVTGNVILSEGKERYSESGEVLFTDYGLSGPPVMQLSCRAGRMLHQGRKPVIELDLAADYEEDALFAALKERAEKRPFVLLENYLVGMFHKRVGQTALKAAGIAPLSKKAESLTEKEIRALTVQFKHWQLPVTGTMGLENAQVTAGGAELSGFDPETLESKVVPGLFACGEVLDVDGDCGGFNLQWAWSSAMLAVRKMGELYGDGESR